MSDVSTFPPLGCRGRLVDPVVVGNIRPSRVIYSFLGEPVLFRTLAFGESTARNACNVDAAVFKLNAIPSNLYVVSVHAEWIWFPTPFESLRQSECYLAIADDQGENPTWNVEKLWRVDFDTIPRHLLPTPGVMPLESS